MEFNNKRTLVVYKGKKRDFLFASKELFKALWFNAKNFHWFFDIIFLFIEKEKNALERLTDKQYKEIFIKGRTKEQIQLSYEKAWEAKNFEIDLYWRRATYFWAFQIASLTGYFVVQNSKNFELDHPKSPEILYFVICIGFITALAWALINQGSKAWQRHWEIHVDMLEEEITGPLYKIVTTAKTFSVSKINDIVSRFFVCIWILMGIQYFFKYLTFSGTHNAGINWPTVIATIIALYFTGTMLFGYGRGRFGERVVRFYSRKFRPQ